MASFDLAIPLTLREEGGYVNNPNDRGGPTKYGITQADMPDVDIESITTEQAAAYYREHYWKSLYSQIESQAVAFKLFDMGVLTGIGEAVKLLQEVLHIPADGKFGNDTLTATNIAGDDILPAYKDRLRQHFERIVQAHPNDAEFLDGWENRVEF